MVVELLLFFSCVCFWVFFGWFWFVSCCFFLLFGCLYVAVSVFCLAYANFSNIPLGSFKITININYGNWLTLLTIINLEIFKELSAVNSLGEKNRTDKDKLPIAVRKDKHNTWTHGLLWRISLRAKVPGGCRLQFEQIARDVQCRKPSSKDDIMRSTWFCCYSNYDNCFNSFRKENCCYRSKASPLLF